jgi:hypothetical protein
MIGVVEPLLHTYEYGGTPPDGVAVALPSSPGQPASVTNNVSASEFTVITTVSRLTHPPGNTVVAITKVVVTVGVTVTELVVPIEFDPAVHAYP